MTQAIKRMAMDESHDSVERMVWKFARHFQRTAGLELTELKAVGDLAVIRAYDTWVPSRGASFPTHVWYCVRNAMLTEVRRAKRRARERSIDPGLMDGMFGHRRTSVLERLWSEIGDDARTIILLVIEAPGELAAALAGSGRRKRARRAILDRALHRGWERARTLTAFWEIEEALEGI